MTTGDVYIPTRFVSRYSLLDAFASQIGAAFARAGWRVNPAQVNPAAPRIFLLLNFPQRLPQIDEWMSSLPGSTRPALLHYYVDHPLGLHTPHISDLAARPGYRLLLPCRDDAHLLRLAWPSLRHITMLHAVAPDSLCDLAALPEGHLAPPGDGPGRPIAVLVTGSIHSPAELEALRSQLPQPLHGVCDDIVMLQMAQPGMPFTQAFDLALPPGMISKDHWQFLAAVWRYCTAALNRQRRVTLVQGLQGLPVVVMGPNAWADVCTGTIQYQGEMAYEALPAALKKSRVCVAWGPSQFAHTFSERLLLSMAAGCATVTDDRLMTRVEFGSSGEIPCLLYDAARPHVARGAIEGLLANPSDAVALALRARELIESAHLWDHRIPGFVGAAADCWR